MPALQVQQFQYPSNINLLDGIRASMSPQYSRRIPSATKAGVQATMNSLWDNPTHRNEFAEALVNVIGAKYVQYASWSNPFAKFKRGKLTFGETIEEVAIGIAQAHQYSLERTDLEQAIFGIEPLTSQSRFHKINRENWYKASINHANLQRAFLSAEDGLSRYIAGQMASISTGDELDEFLLMTSLFRRYYDNGGFYQVNVPDLTYVTDPGATPAKQFLTTVREYTTKLQFINEKYNAAKMPSVARPDELELFITPRANAVIDVEALSAAFNIDKMEIASRTTIVPEENFNIPGAQAVLTTRDFFVVADTVMEMQSANNPVTLIQNFIWHHQQIISASPFPPAILLTTEPSTQTISVSPPVTGIGTVSFSDLNGNDAGTTLTRGNMYAIAGASTVNTAGLPAGYIVTNTGLTHYLVGATSTRTQVIRNEFIVIGYDETSATVTLHSEATADSTFQKDTPLTVTGPIVGGGLSLSVDELPATLGNTGLPKISVPNGGAVTGASLTADPGKWDTRSITAAYQWTRDGTNISGATSDVYVVVTADVGHTVAVVVTASKSGYTGASATSAGIAIAS